VRWFGRTHTHACIIERAIQIKTAILCRHENHHQFQTQAAGLEIPIHNAYITTRFQNDTTNIGQLLLVRDL
jgi:hypothetical protein